MHVSMGKNKYSFSSFWYIYEVDYRFLALYANLAIWILILR
jgi:hypothetical protein